MRALAGLGLIDQFLLYTVGDSGSKRGAITDEHHTNLPQGFIDELSSLLNSTSEKVCLLLSTVGLRVIDDKMPPRKCSAL